MSATGNSYVYFVYNPDSHAIKIGVSRNPQKRFVALQIGSPATLRLLGFIPGTAKNESALHSKFWNLRIRGEWFKLHAPLKQYIGRVTDVHWDDGKHDFVPGGLRINKLERRYVERLFNEREYIFEPQMAELLGVNIETMRQWRESGLIDFPRIGDPRYEPQHIEAAIAKGLIKV